MSKLSANDYTFVTCDEKSLAAPMSLTNTYNENKKKYTKATILKQIPVVQILSLVIRPDYLNYLE